jgi:hypothetical protein
MERMTVEGIESPNVFMAKRATTGGSRGVEAESPLLLLEERALEAE